MQLEETYKCNLSPNLKLPDCGVSYSKDIIIFLSKQASTELVLDDRLNFFFIPVHIVV